MLRSVGYIVVAIRAHDKIQNTHDQESQMTKM